MPGLRGDAGGDDHHVGAVDVGVVVAAGDLRVEAFDRAALAEVERLALGDALGDVEQDDVAEFLLGGEVGERAADVAGADRARSSCEPWGQPCPSLARVLRTAVSARPHTR